MATVSNPGLGITIKNTKTEVFSGSSSTPAAYTDLDLSAYCGTKKSLVCLLLYNPNASSKLWAVRPNGETELAPGAGNYCPNVGYASATSFITAITCTDNSGVVEWYYQAAAEAGTTIDLLWWLNL